ncbi:hypothetical protein FGB62_217g02 [Gracilaria domingensis]|nr:hypothetical protein FGB62_217g02 [Gracilaria domingensis]
MRDHGDITSGRTSNPKNVVAGAGARQRYDDDESYIGRGAGVECFHREKRGTISRKEPKKRFLETLNKDSEIEDDDVGQLLTGKIRARVRNSNPLRRKKRKKNMNVAQPDEDEDEIEPGTAPATRRRSAGFVQPQPCLERIRRPSTGLGYCAHVFCHGMRSPPPRFASDK